MKLKSLFSRVFAASAFVLAAVGAHAETYQFTLTGAYTASWQFDSMPVPDDAVVGSGFFLYDVPGNFPGALLGLTDLIFFHGDLGGGIEIDDYYGESILLAADGLQLYTGSEETPTFKLGIFALTEYQGTDTYTLTVTSLAPVPEPASIALLLGGLGVVGLVARRRKAQD